ncbi:MAG: thiamine-phosphate kinase [Saprospiraceae bacterium]|nr:thiamine-phosphate kinase [Bacteroidia bacterium]NNE13446.1 thiamine-phosphate kinase [Saprospiraceae bacterium]NNL93815.1 thiamine-phosphate kinase [Saprospiraceae bacterium]
MSNFDQKFTDVNQLGEFNLIDRLTSGFDLKNKSSILGVGDDAAVIEHGKTNLLVSTDLLVEGIHFDLMYSPLKHLGYKAVVVNLSDIYAMNGTPQQITVSMALSSKFSVEALEEFYAGIKEACRIYNVDLVGGDTTSSPKGLTISITAIGTADKKEITYRSGAKPGDILCITGDLGAAYLGLQILEREKQLYLNNPGIQPDLEEQKYLLERQLKPEARKDIIRIFKDAKLIPTSMIDISDGLASDLMHICKASEVGAFVEESKIPINQEAQLMAIKFQMDPITTALNGGEDYELLFSIDESDLEKIRLMPSVYIIGEIVKKEDGIKLHTTGGNVHPLKAQGWDHFDDKT